MTRQQKQLLKTPSSVAPDSAGEKCFHPLFEAKVAKTPDPVAALCEDHSRKRRKLNREEDLTDLGVEDVGWWQSFRLRSFSVDRRNAQAIGTNV